MRILEFLLVVSFVTLASCSIHMQVPTQSGKHPKGKVVIVVPAEKPEVKPIPKEYGLLIH